MFGRFLPTAIDFKNVNVASLTVFLASLRTQLLGRCEPGWKALQGKAGKSQVKAFLLWLKLQ